MTDAEVVKKKKRRNLMKTYEKMAEEFAADAINNLIRVSTERGFIAGFKAAKKLAISKYGDLVYHQGVLHMLETLGEEEVE